MADTFLPLSQEPRNWVDMAVAPNGNVYVCVYGGDIYMQTGGVGDFVALGQTARDWQGMAAAPNGNVYANVYNDNIYMQTAGVGAFVSLGYTGLTWYSMTAAPNGNIYACADGDDIYMQTAGAGAFVALGQGARYWYSMTAAPNGNIYASVHNGDIYMQTAGVGAFVALGQTVRGWAGIAAAPNGNIYAGVYGGDIYMQTGGVGDFVALGQTVRNWVGLVVAPNGNVYANVLNGDIYMQAFSVPPPAPSFEESRERLQGRGYITIYIDKLTEASKIFEIINEAIGSYLYSGYDGKYRYRVFEIERGEDVIQFTDNEIFSFTQSIDAAEVFSNVRAEFSYRTLQDYAQVYLYQKLASQYLQGSPIPVSMEKRLPFSQRPDAIFWAQRELQMKGERLVLSRATVSAKGWTLEPGMFAQFTYTRQAINGVFEVLEVKRDLGTSRVDLVLGDQHGMSGGEGAGGGTTVDPGFWTEDAPTFPSALGGGNAETWDPAWSAAQKSWARQNMGFWCEESGFADATDGDSLLPSTWV